jgi:trehalose/maltose hydrolase-like predicted phosphorylase
VTTLSDFQELDLRRGVLTRWRRVRDSLGHVTGLTNRRFLYMGAAHLGSEEMKIIPENWSGLLRIRSELDGTVTNSGVPRYRGLACRHLDPVRTGRLGADTMVLVVETNQSHIRVAEAARTRVFRDGAHLPGSDSVTEQPGRIGCEFSVTVAVGQPVAAEKTVAIATSRDRAVREAGVAAAGWLDGAGSFDELLQQHVLAWDHLWARFPLQLRGGEDDRVLPVLRLHVFHLLQTAGPNSIGLDVGVPARGLHGEAYRGHALVHLNPQSGRWLPDTSYLQRHVGIAVAYNAWQYYQSTGDRDFLALYGAEIILEIARFFASIASYDREQDRYVIRGVIGPDEFHTSYPDSPVPGIDNNAYANVMKVWLLLRAPEVLGLLPEHRRVELTQTLGLTAAELERWEHICRRMYVPFHDVGIISRFEGYEKLEEIGWEDYYARYGNIRRLDRILEAEGDSPNRYQVSKQADVLMLFYLLSAEELGALMHRLDYDWSPSRIPETIDYYLARTSNGSTLSSVVHAWVLARANRERAFDEFVEALRSDVADVQGGTTAEGIHLAAMAGTVDVLQRCFAGVETRGDVLWLNPYWSQRLGTLKFSLLYRDHYLTLSIADHTVLVRSAPGNLAPVQVGCHGQVCEPGNGQSLEFIL